METFLLNIAIQALESYLTVKLAVPEDHDIATHDAGVLSALTELRLVAREDIAVAA